MRRLKTLVTAVVGFTILAIGIAMLVLPGPGLVTIGVGLLVLSAEFAWARRALGRLKRGAQQIRTGLKGKG